MISAMTRAITDSLDSPMESIEDIVVEVPTTSLGHWEMSPLPRSCQPGTPGSGAAQPVTHEGGVQSRMNCRIAAPTSFPRSSRRPTATPSQSWRPGQIDTRKLDIEDAYSIQTINIDRPNSVRRSGDRSKGWTPSEPMQQLLGVHEPDFGGLTARFSKKAEESTALKAGQLIFSGGVTAPVPVLPGGSVTFEFDGLGVIEVSGA